MKVASSSSAKNGLPSARSTRSAITGSRHRPGRERLHEVADLARLERLEPELRRVPGSSSPRRTRFEQLGPRRRNDEERAGDVACQTRNQIEERLFGPVQVLDQQSPRGLLSVSCVRRSTHSS